MNIIVTGGTGLAGSEIIRQAIDNPAIDQIHVLSRKPIGLSSPKINQVIHTDFMNYDGLESLFRNTDACLWALGISQSQVSKEQYHVITYDYTIQAGSAMLAANPQMKFIFLSGAGADSTEKSRTLFARVKGKAENTLKEMNFRQMTIVRPGGIKPVHKNPNAPLVNKLMYPIFPLFELVMPSMVISSVQLAKAMLYLALNGSEKVILENNDLKEIAGKY